MKKINIDYSRDDNLGEQAKTLLKKHYLVDGEDSPQDGFARAAVAYCFGDYELAQRIYDYVSQNWFMFASPILSNAPVGEWVKKSEDDEHWCDYEWVGEEPKAMPISCFALEVQDSLKGQIGATTESAWLSVKGGGVGLHNSIRANSKKAPGPIPFMKTLDASAGYYQQSSARRGSYAYYMDVSHPDIMEHINFRIPTGGDSARKADNRKNFHVAVNITDDFVDAVTNDEEYDLKCPHSGEVREKVKARSLFEHILETRALTGEPYLFFKDVANRQLPECQREKGLTIKGSNLCSEIALPTDEERTFVCCLSSLNIYHFDEWKDTEIVKDLTRFLDNVLEWFIMNAPEELSKAVFSAKMERAIGIGALGFHSYLQRNMIPFESGGFNSAVQKNHQIFSRIKSQAVESSQELAKERGEPEDMVGSGMRNSHLLAIAPNANSSMIAGVSPSIEVISSNMYNSRTRVGLHVIQNKDLDNYLKENYSEQEVKDIWNQIFLDKGSVQNIECLDDDVKKVFKTAWEIDQHWVVQHAEDRQDYICQAQSLNLFFPAGSPKSEIASVHYKAMKNKKLKSLYYYRTESKQTADVVKKIERRPLEDWNDDEVCVACEG